MSDQPTLDSPPPRRSFGFSLDGVQLVKLSDWQAVHDKTCPYTHAQGAIGGRNTYSFTPNMLGTTEKVTCACGAEIDLTDYDTW